MIGSGAWVLGAMAWLWAGGGAGDARSRHEQNREAVRLQVQPASAPASKARSVAARQQGDPTWRKGQPASPGELQVAPSAQAALAGEQISVKVSAREGSMVRAEVFRLGVYGGTGALKVWSGGPYTVSTLTRCSRAPCNERQTFSFEIARDWAPGLYLVKVTRADGLRSFTSIVVKAPQAAGPRS